ncbi:hypothetical protein MnTg02_00352 [bacterium MnTg02]|nr:hypothetical protein MnTg02_00352 [bacterium MnTg02]
MTYEVNIEAPLLNLADHRIDQERHIVIENLDNRSVLGRIRLRIWQAYIAAPDLMRIFRLFGEKGERRDRHIGQLIRTKKVQILLVHMSV